MRVELTKDFTFESAHRLPMVPSDHKCSRMHGHSYRIEVRIAGEVDAKLGWLVDFGEIAAQVEPLLKRELDHRVLNDVAGLENATAENLARWLWERRQAPPPPSQRRVWDRARAVTPDLRRRSAPSSWRGWRGR